MSVKLLMEHHLELLSLKGGFIGLSESTLVKMPHCWKSHVTAQILFIQASRKECVIKKYFSLISMESYVMSLQMNCLNEMVLLSTQNLCSIR